MTIEAIREQDERTKRMQDRLKAIEKARRKEFKNALHDGEYELQGANLFFPRRDDADCLSGEPRTYFSGHITKPIRFTGKSLLVYVQEGDGPYFAWIHA
jgi:hypothetical protein